MPLLLDPARLTGMRLVYIIALLVLAFALWVRFAPSDPRRWHVNPDRVAVNGRNGYATHLNLTGDPVKILQDLDRVALATPRTKRLAGSPESGLVTYVTRSRLWGFPDYTSVAATGENGQTTLSVAARLRFGLGDGGVNKARVRAWLKALQALHG